MLEKLKDWEIKYYYLVVLLISSVFFLSRIYEPSLSGDEAKYALIAKNMIKTGNFLIPSLGFEYYFKKPPFFFWIISLFFKLFGTSEFSARLPSAIFGIADSLLVFYLGWKISKDKLFALISSLIFILNFEVIRITTIVRFDSFILFINLISVILLHKPNIFKAFLTILLISTGILTKGPLSLIGLTSVSLYFLFRKNFKYSLVCIFVAIVSLLPFLSYLFLVSKQHPEFIKEFFGNQILGRINGSLKEGTPRSFFFYERIILKHFWPWNIGILYILCLLILRRFEKLKKIFKFENCELFQILTIMFLITFIPLHFISLKFTRYSYYFYPFLSLVTSAVIRELRLINPVLIFSLLITILYSFATMSCPCYFHKDKLKDLRPLVKVASENYKDLSIDKRIKRDYFYPLLFYFDDLRIGKGRFLITNRCSKRFLLKYKNFCIVKRK